MKKLKSFVKKKYKFDMSDIETIAMVGDTLTTEVLFGNENKMPTVWCYRYNKEVNKLVETFPDLHKLENKYALNVNKVKT